MWELDELGWAQAPDQLKKEIVWAYRNDLEARGGDVEANATLMLAWLDEQIRRGDAVQVVLLEGQAVLSTARLHPQDVPSADLVEAVQTTTDVQRRGYGGRLLRHIQDRARRSLAADIHVDNAASEALFGKAGFVPGATVTDGHRRWTWAPPQPGAARGQAWGSRA